MKIAIHQPNFIPWLPYFYKMAMADKFIILKETQFRKGGFENRYTLSNGKIVTNPIKHGLDLLKHKEYVNGENLLQVNLRWIMAIKDTLGIDTEIVFDYPSELTGTERLIDLIKAYGGDIYITNPGAKDKYLDEDLMRRSGIEIEYLEIPKHLQLHTFEAFEKLGIKSIIKQLSRKHEVLNSVL